jgi:Flp pilus assembly protein TadG
MPEAAISRSRRQRGNAMIEFALSALVLATMFLATFQFGYTFYVYSRLQTAIRNGARYASIRTIRTGSSASITNFKTAVQQMVVYGSPTATAGTPVVPGLTTSGITVNVTGSSGAAASSSVMPYKVQVYVSNYSLDALFKTYSFSSKPYENFPYVGIWQPTDVE